MFSLFRPLLRAAWPLVLVGIAACSAAAWEFGHIAALAQQRYGAAATRLAQEWENVIASARPLPETDKLRRINEFINRRIRYDNDAVVWQQEDYWATPLETIGKAAGDCEDFSLIKYFSLREAGMPREKLRMTYVRAKMGGPNSAISQAHMVLAYYATPDAEPLILDSLITDIRPASRRPDLTPVYSFNSDGVFVGGARAAASVDRLSRWKDLQLRMQADGMTP